ncbi:hypothetical protein KDH_21990 [Dictyobacter sp. S3.2.2.5]|uniref:Membrane insertase YidC/Oxa/ALB C-terminal domain-containing protein n=1 Tax=Dictyobacter halimunensis TaxID=3026934 RepID=A0ABQ6FNS7_9CHLR|nr:hypothetical protein KDH_21990 [Dictyobacter sp. S3.2.2.5]
MSIIATLFNTLFTYPILNALLQLYSWLGDFSVALVALTVGISLLLLPFTLRQLRQARMMRQIQPQIQALRKQHASDHQAQAQALQELYKAHGIRTRSTFLLLLIQAPIYSGLYFALNMILQASSVSTLNDYLYPFVTHLATMPNLHLTWFTILNATWHISLGAPDPTAILPILTGVLTLIQTWVAQPLASVEAREGMQHINQNMQWLFFVIPAIITVVIAWRFAAGLALYRIVSLLMNIGQQYIVSHWGGNKVTPALAQATGFIQQAEQRTQSQAPKPRRRNRRHGSSRRRK